MVMEEYKPILCLDFDGVCHSFESGWTRIDDIPDPPVPGLFEFLTEASKVFYIHIYSGRSRDPSGIEAMKEWFSKWRPTSIAPIPLSFPMVKPPSLVALDDRCITFTGEWPNIEALRKFKPWNK